MPYMLVMTVILVICWAMIVNVSKLIKDRMMMQNAADNAALSIAVYKARVLNRVGKLNYQMACVLYDGPYGLIEAIAGVDPVGTRNYSYYGEYNGAYGTCSSWLAPAYFMRFSDNQQAVACMDDMSHGFCPGTDKGIFSSDKNVKLVKDYIDFAVKHQESIWRPFPGLAAIYAREIASRQEIDARGNPCGPKDLLDVLIPRGLSLGLKVNENKVKYYETYSVCISIEALGYHKHLFGTPHFTYESPKSWLYADITKFARSQKIVVTATKRSNAESNKGYPLLGKWLGIKWPDITVVAAAAVYNRNGPMFPLDYPSNPSNKISRVWKEYQKSKKGGWDAHLVPIETPLTLH